MSGNYRALNGNDRTNPPVQSFSIGRANDQEIIRYKRYKLIKSKICGTIALCLSGTVLVIIGLYWMSFNRPGYIPFLLIGLLALVPGSYGAYEIIGTMKGWPGFEQLLNQQDEQDFDDEEAENMKGWLNF